MELWPFLGLGFASILASQGVCTSISFKVYRRVIALLNTFFIIFNKNWTFYATGIGTVRVIPFYELFPFPLKNHVPAEAYYGKHSKISNTFLFPVSNLLVFGARIHTMLARIATKQNPDQPSDLDLCCLSRPFWWATIFFLVWFVFLRPSQQLWSFGDGQFT